MMVVAVGALSLMDGCLKILSLRYPALQVTALRGLTTLPIVLVWTAMTVGFRPLAGIRVGLHLLRGILGITSLALFAFGVRSLPMSEAYSIFFVAPMLITAFAALFLGERAGIGQWIAIACGLLGVMIVLRPSGAQALSIPGLAILATAVCYALSAITVRVLSRTDSTQSIVLTLMVLVAFTATLLALPDWRPLQPADWRVLLALAVTGSIGQWAFTEAFRLGEASVLAPLEYTALAWGVGMDWVLWQTTPAARTLFGAAVVILSGTYVIRRERVHVEAEHP
jgi:drug/metabolite transporter (DMT)-like permease